ncbi:glycosyltransferase family 1 protein [bacterium]|nr:glycosyltransferase family 1 protein [bacterium]NBX49274.1 glycosyltransferase family 1 protein [bacterium]
MHILVLSPVYPPYKGGMGSVAAQEVNLIREAGHKVRVMTPRYKRKAATQEEWVTLLDPWYAWGNAAVLPWKPLREKISGAEVVHIHYPFFGTALPTALMTKYAKKHLVISWHMRAQAEPRAWVRRALFAVHRWVEEPLVKYLADVICVSTQEYGGLLNLPQEKIRVVPFGVDDRRFTPRRNTERRTACGISGEACVFLFVGGMDRAHAFKGVPLLLHAYAKMEKTGATKLWLVGDGDLRDTYEQLAKELGIKERVTFWGGVSAEELPEMYQAADVHVLPSVSGAEAYGLVTCEASASGIPSIVSALPGVRALVAHEQTGLHVEPGNIASLTSAMEYMAKHADVRRKWGKAAQEKISKEATLQEEQAALLRAYTEQGTLGE